MKYLLYGMVGFMILLGVGGGVVYFIGSQTPETHREVISVEIQAPTEKVWALIREYEAIPSWWNDGSADAKVSTKFVIEKLPDGREVTWSSEDARSRVGFYTTEEVVGRKLVRKIVDDVPAGTLSPIGGSWMFELESLAQGKLTKFTLTEDSVIRPKLFRAFAKLSGYRMALESFSAALKREAEKSLAPGSK